MKKKWLGVSLCAIIIIGIAVYYGISTYRDLSNKNAALQATNATLEQNIAMLEQELASSSVTLASTSQSLQDQQNINSGFTTEIGQIAGTVTSLQTLAATDPQLLQKYSKVYFLSDNYVPASLSSIDTQYLFNTNSPQTFLSGSLPFLDSLLANASSSGVPLRIISAYRSFYQQAQLKLDYTSEYGSGANQFSADQGYSEHQLGTAVDFGMKGVQNLRAPFASSSAYQWLTSNAYRYGFVLSYPPNNTYYQFEPWHWRFVGITLATFLHTNNEQFYNMTQRDLGQYLISFFRYY